MLTAGVELKIGGSTHNDQHYQPVSELSVGDTIVSAFTDEALSIADIWCRTIDCRSLLHGKSLWPVKVFPKRLRGLAVSSDTMLVSPEQLIFCIVRNDFQQRYGGPNCRSASELISYGCAVWETSQNTVTYYAVILEHSAFVDANGLLLQLPGVDEFKDRSKPSEEALIATPVPVSEKNLFGPNAGIVCCLAGEMTGDGMSGSAV